jgi:hypothetical protein
MATFLSLGARVANSRWLAWKAVLRACAALLMAAIWWKKCEKVEVEAWNEAAHDAANADMQVQSKALCPVPHSLAPFPPGISLCPGRDCERSLFYIILLSTIMDPAHRGSRHVYQDAIPLELCQELLFIQRSLAVAGYRPQVQSLTLYEMILTCPQLLPVVAKARQLIWDLVEAQFDSPCSIWPETTSLISWTAGASIGWHHDANR